MNAFIDSLKYDEAGLIPAIAQDVTNGQVLMVAWMNKESLKITLETGVMTYWSRSRKKLWKKGESSGSIQTVREIYTDCDRDVLLFKVDQQVAACHTGYRSCFYTKLDPKTFSETTVGEKIF